MALEIGAFELGAAELQRTVGTVGGDVHGVDDAPLGQSLADLLDAVAAGLQHHHFDGYFVGPLQDTSDYFGILSYYQGDKVVLSITTQGKSVPHVTDKLSILMDRALTELREGRQEIPADGDTTIEYYGTDMT